MEGERGEENSERGVGVEKRSKAERREGGKEALLRLKNWILDLSEVPQSLRSQYLPRTAKELP